MINERNIPTAERLAGFIALAPQLAAASADLLNKGKVVQAHNPAALCDWVFEEIRLDPDTYASLNITPDLLDDFMTLFPETTDPSNDPEWDSRF